MYSQRSVDIALKKIEQVLGHEPQYHSVSACDQAADHFNIKYHRHVEEYGEGKDHLLSYDEEERKWIRNERAIAQVDYLYYATRYSFIQVDNQVIHYQPQLSQQIMNAVRARIEDLGWAIMLQVLKARQVGITTDSQIVISHRTLFYPNVVALTGSCDKDKSEIMLGKYRLLYENLPYWLRPDITRDRSGSFMNFGGLNSQLIVQHGRQMTGIGRGNTPTAVHLCLSPRTLIRTEDGTLTPIDEIKVGQKVITSNGLQSQVKAVWKSPRANELSSEIAVWGTPTRISATRDHQILTEVGWKKAADIQSGDYLIYPLRPISKASGTVPIMMYGTYKRVGSKHGRIVDVPASFELGRLVGLYLAEGSLVRTTVGKPPNSVVFSIHSNEESRTREWISAAFPSDQNARLATRRKNSYSCVLPFSSKGFANFLLEHFGEKDSKRVSDLCWEYGREFAEGVVHGYIAGDGHYSARDNDIFATSIRPAILFGVRELIASLGYGWSQITYRDAGVFYNRNCKETWILNVTGTTAKAYRERFEMTVHNKGQGRAHWRISNGQVLLEVESNTDGLSETFYDLTVDHPLHDFLTSCGIVKNSELAEFENPEILIDAGLLPGIHESPEILFILESTANGPHNWWFKTWQYSKGNYWEGRAKFCPTFLPWFTRPDIYPTKGWLKQHPVPVDWSPLPVTIAHAERARKSVRANDTLRAYFPENWYMAKEQMWFWEVNREEHRAKGMLDVFQREFCSDDMEAFTASGLSVFDVDVLSDYNNACQEPKAVYAFRAREDVIPARFHPQDSEIDRSMKTIDMGRYQMVPVKWQGWEQTNVDGRFLLFEWPEEFEEYGLGVDTSDGIGKDRSVIEVIRKGSSTRNDAQVGELASPYINAEDLAPMCHAIALLYQNGKQRQPRIAIEIGRNGEITQLVLKKLGWSHFHNWVRYDRKKIEPGKAVRLGWITNSWSRPMMMDKLIKSLRDGTLDINSREFVREMQSLHRDWDQQDARAEYNAFDDRIMALGIIYFSLHILDFTMPGKDVSYLKQQRTDEFAWRYKPTVYDDHEMRPVPEHGGSNLVLPAHPGALSSDRSWEDYE